MDRIGQADCRPPAATLRRDVGELRSSEGGRSSRRREGVEREYGEEKWPAVARQIATEIAAEPDAGLARIRARVSRAQRLAPDFFATHRYVIDGQEIQTSLSAAVGAVRGIVLGSIAEACRHETDLIVELGSGWGNALLSAWTSGGPRHALYVAAEYTEAGRDAASRLAALDPSLEFRALEFDYHEPDLSGLGAREHAVLFSSHSIEQIPKVSPALFDAMRSVAARVTCVHFEPVGFQVADYEGTASTREYALEQDYNVNLMGALEAEAEAGRIEIDFVRTDVFGLNPDNPTTIVRWQAGPV